MSLLACENAEGISRGNRGDILNILGRKKLNDFKCKYLPLACENAEGISRGKRGGYFEYSRKRNNCTILKCKYLPLACENTERIPGLAGGVF